MRSLTPTWTWTHSRILLALAVALAGATISAWQTAASFTVVVALLFLLTFMLGLSLDPVLGGSAGLVVAAGLTFFREAMGLWEAPEALAMGLTEAVLLIAAGSLAGWAGRGLEEGRREDAQRQPGRRAGRPPGDAHALTDASLRDQTAYGALGVLEAELGEVRLEEEMERARLHRRPLAVLWLLVEVHGKARTAHEEVQRRARRAAVRTVEAALRLTDVPFAYDERCLIILLPETGGEEAKSVTTRLNGALGDASFVPEPGSKTRVSLSEYVRLRFGATTFEQGEEEADLLDLAPALSNSSALSRGNE